MPDSPTPATPEPADAGISAAPEEPAADTSETPDSPGPAAPDAPVGAPSETAPAPSSTAPAGGRGGCMTTMIGLFVLVAALFGLATQL